ncbi:MAG: tRNA lysidine(34) synthetase TilS, partial [Candidatus Sacchiramonaceae bacterium]|nr:tRNA lysidine(34) synthetase TilS [Candidatus Saccharimonadaceae bacterium]
LELVRDLAKKYGFEFVSEQGRLGSNASEDIARRARYGFLRKIAAEQSAKIATAHHKNDIVETIAINLHRGTGWRGLAVLDSPDIWRPLLQFEKSQILNYAKRNNLAWREDSTNSDEKYLRNKFRRQITANLNSESTQQIFDLWQAQIRLKDDIDREVSKISDKISEQKADKKYYQRYFLAQIDQKTATEILRHIILENTGEILTRQTLLDIWIKLKTTKSGKKIPVSKEWQIIASKTEFSFEKFAKR